MSKVHQEPSADAKWQHAENVLIGYRACTFQGDVGYDPPDSPGSAREVSYRAGWKVACFDKAAEMLHKAGLHCRVRGEADTSQLEIIGGTSYEPDVRDGIGMFTGRTFLIYFYEDNLTAHIVGHPTEKIIKRQPLWPQDLGIMLTDAVSFVVRTMAEIGGFEQEPEIDLDALKVRVVAHKGQIVIIPREPDKGIVLDRWYPSGGDRLGCVLVDSKSRLGVSKKALKLMKQVMVGRDCVGDLDWHSCDDGTHCFSWWGPLYRIVDPNDSQAARGFSIHPKKCVIIPNVLDEDLVAEVEAAIERGDSIWREPFRIEPDPYIKLTTHGLTERQASDLVCFWAELNGTKEDEEALTEGLDYDTFKLDLDAGPSFTQVHPERTLIWEDREDSAGGSGWAHDPKEWPEHEAHLKEQHMAIGKEQHMAIGKVQVMGADEVKTMTLGWTVREFDGCKIHLFDGTPPERDEDGQWVGLEPITERDAIKPGVQILVPGLFGELILMTIEHDEHDGSLIGRSHREDGSPGQLTGLLKFDGDERGCWACTGTVNMSGIKKMELTTGV